MGGGLHGHGGARTAWLLIVRVLVLLRVSPPALGRPVAGGSRGGGPASGASGKRGGTDLPSLTVDQVTPVRPPADRYEHSLYAP